MIENRKPVLTLTAKDFRIDTFRCGGHGGQHINKVESGVRFTHVPSGCVQECREERSQHANKKKAFERLCNQPKFQKWLKVETMRRIGTKVYEASMNPATIEERVEELMKPEYIKEEYFKNETMA